MYGYVLEIFLIQRKAQSHDDIHLKEDDLHQEEVSYRSEQSEVHLSVK